MKLFIPPKRAAQGIGTMLLVLLTLALAVSPAKGQSIQRYGDGANGALNVSGTVNTDAVKAVVLSSVSTTTSVVIANFGSTAFNPGDWVLVIDMTPPTPNVRNYAFGIVQSKSCPMFGPCTLSLVAPLSADPSQMSAGVQVIRVPRYTNVTLLPGGQITCDPLTDMGSGQMLGGVICFFVSGTLTVESRGKINAEGKGFQAKPGIRAWGQRRHRTGKLW